MTELALEDLTFAHGTNFRLGPVDLVFPAASRTAIVGPSGAGKSTLLRCIAGLEEPLEGRVLEQGILVNARGQRTAPHKRKLGFLFQDGALWPHMTALQHLRFAAPDLRRGEAQEWLDRVGLQDKGRRRPGQLSGGEGRRLALARALCGGADTLLLDEPLHSLDVHLRDGLALLIRELTAQRSLTTIVVTHDREEALAMAETLVVLDGGRVVEAGRADELLAAPRTAWTAAFLARAACWKVAPTTGLAATPFGEFPLPTSAAHAGAGERDSAASTTWALATLPGDVVLAQDPDPTAAAPRGTVLHGEPHPGGWTLAVALAGQTLRVPSDRPLPSGTEVALRLVTPRLLPWGSEESAP